jgi:hypothetical protein
MSDSGIALESADDGVVRGNDVRFNPRPTTPARRAATGSSSGAPRSTTTSCGTRPTPTAPRASTWPTRR